MSESHARLATYLNDHLSGATAAIELLGHLTKAYAGQEIAWFAEELQEQVNEDVRTLERYMADLGIARSPVRAAAAWVAEKFARLKLRIDDPSMHGFHLLESLEVLSLGIEGKRLLWLSLSSAATGSPALAKLDFAALIARAEAQRADVERRRVETARVALA